MTTCYIVGLGGIGSWLVEPLVRFCVSGLRADYDFVLIDGDHYSQSNQSRQCIHPKLTGMNKASATALKMRQYFPTVEFKEIPEFVTKENISQHIPLSEESFIFNCCDNNYCRKILTEHMDAFGKQRRTYLFSGGNETTDGNSHIYATDYRMAMSKSLFDSHPEVKNAEASEDRGAMSCQQLANMPASNQIIITNFWVAAVMLQQFYLITKKDKIIQETFFDINTSAINAIPITASR